MLTPIELQGTTLKSGFGYNKKDADQFLEMVYHNYEELYKENLALKDKVENLNESVKHYKEIEKTLQKALVLAEQTSSDITSAAKKKAAMIEKDAKGRAQIILHDAKVERNRIQDQTRNLVQQYDKYRSQFKQLAASQVELLDSEGYQLTASFETDDSDPELFMDSEDDYSYFQDSAEKTSEEALETFNKVETLSAETRIFEKVNPRELNMETGSETTGESSAGSDFEMSLNEPEPGFHHHAGEKEADANVSSEAEARQNSMFYEMAKQQELEEQRERERQRELAEQQERERQRELAEQQERERQRELEEQQERERQRELEEQQERERQRELAEQQERERQRELEERQERARQRELEEQQERERQQELEERQERARQRELAEQQSLKPLHELSEQEVSGNNRYADAEKPFEPQMPSSVPNQSFAESETTPKPSVSDMMFEEPMPASKPSVPDMMFEEPIHAPKPPVPDVMFEEPIPAPKPSRSHQMFGEPESTPRHSVPDMMYESQTASPYSSHRASRSEQPEAVARQPENAIQPETVMSSGFSVEVKEVTASPTEASSTETRSRFSESISPIPNSMEDDDEFEFLS